MKSPIGHLIAESLDVEFRQVSFFECSPEDMPFTEPIGRRGWLITFAPQFPASGKLDTGLLQDIELLHQLVLGTCRYGATDSPVRPFITEIGADKETLTGIDVLAGLKARHFRSEHIPRLDSTRIEYPGYHPYSDNDEIHNDFAEQVIFEHENEGEFDGAHGKLKRYVRGGQLWYVLLHPKKHDEFTEFVFLFAVGRSPHGGRLMGVVTHQFCHNLCD